MSDKNFELATLGTGCFWCTEAVFDTLKGVESVFPGYSGGHVVNPTYEQICEKTTGHAEVVQIKFDPTVISFEELLEVFWRTHNPTTPNQQGNDVGPQYRSAIFYHDENQKAIAEKSLQEADASDLWPDPIVTEMNPLEKFYQAEDYHKDYMARVGDRNPYCTFVVKPKVEKFKKEFKDKLKD
jgi:peptide-methionine (S)-S-oxide reductase